MTYYSYANVQKAFVNELRYLLARGEEVTVRGSTTKEILMNSFPIKHPTERVIILKHRNTNIFAQIAETLWMLAGRDDMDFLEHFIPSCRKWSDDGETWRGAYGPRLRNWRGHDAGHGFIMDDYIPQELWHTDQLQQVANKINTDKHTRQAVISIWDPASDWVRNSKDYPCNNWLHFIVRDGKLHLNVMVRSNDIMFGFSHADFFGWSVLLQMMAYWTATEIGSINWNVTSWHLYEKHWDKALKIVNDNEDTKSVYDIGFETPVFNTPFSWLDGQLDLFFEAERLSRANLIDGAMSVIGDIADSFIRMCARLIIAYNTYKADIDDYIPVIHQLSLTPPCDMKVAALEYFNRQIPGFIGGVQLTGNEIEFFENYLRTIRHHRDASDPPLYY